ncbi:MAG TPA: Lrp/AsnC family transcriptional regulator [Allosphingosinicella sp.]
MARRPLDATDEKLLALLERDARRPVVALAKAVGLSRSAVQERLARLEESGAIAAYTIVRGEDKSAAVSAVLLMRIATRPCEAVLRRFADWPEIKALWSVAGPTVDAILAVEAADGESLGDFRERLAAVPGVAEVVTAPVLRTVVNRRTPPETD